MSKSRKEIHTEKLEGVQNSLKSLSEVAAAFKNTDAKLAEAIGDPTPDTNKDIKNSESYKKLMKKAK